MNIIKIGLKRRVRGQNVETILRDVENQPPTGSVDTYESRNLMPSPQSTGKSNY